LEIAKLADIAEVASGGGAPQDLDAFTTQGIPFIRAGSLNPLVNGEPEDSLEHLTEAVAKEHGLRKFPPNTVVFAKSGMSATKGHVYRLRSHAYVVNHLAALVPSDRVDPGFLEHTLRVFSPMRLIQDAAYPSIRLSDVSTMHVPLPSLTEQRRIAAILDKINELRSKRRATLAQLNNLTQSMFLDLFGDPATNPKDWPYRAIGELASKFSDGPFGSNLKSSHYKEHGVRVVRLQNIGAGEFVDDDKAYISEEHFSDLKKHECRPGDVLVGTLGDPNLRACIQPEWLQVALNKADCVQIRPDEKVASAAYICALLNQPATERMAQDLIAGQTRLRISMGRLRGLQVPVPPLNLQREFTLRIGTLEKLKAAHRASLSKLDALFASLQHRAFRGEL
jgi:type I restriction enzyme S subunit